MTGRRTPAVPFGDRLAGHPEQIAVLCEHVDDAAHAVAIAGRIIEALRTPLVLGDLELTVPVSVGMALAADLGADPDQLLAHADAAMYLAKNNGRSRAELFDDTPPVNLKTASLAG